MIIEVDDALEHHGVKGMKWGVTNGRRPDGKLTRPRQAVVNQNDKLIARGERKAAARALKGKTADNNAREHRRASNLEELRAQNDRLKAGKLWSQDKMRIFNTVSLYDIINAYDRDDL